ncbi:hypothetical protein [Metabacillus indicus]|uniref:hypothetical protein n=1 Tax=Metabacillus indicus TaxID=246786 RepID=UPI000B28CA58|nr:hypothetical protein [Metabacillus indicus]
MSMNERLRRKMEQKGEAAAQKREVKRQVNAYNFNPSEYDRAAEVVREFHRKRDLIKT